MVRAIPETRASMRIELESEPDIARWSGLAPPRNAAWNLFRADALRVLPLLKWNHYHCVVTSPPYFWQRDYGTPGQVGHEETIEGYVAAIVETMEAVKRVLHATGTLFLNLGDTFYSGKGQPHGQDRKHNGRRMEKLRAVDKSGLGPPQKTLLGMPWRVALAMIDQAWILRSAIIWRREHALPEPSALDRPWRTYEFVFLFVKSRRYHFDRGPLQNLGDEDVWTIESRPQSGREHPAAFPRELVQRCLELGNAAAGPVLDPFVGSGTVMWEALAKGMPADGIDINHEYCAALAAALGKAR